MKNVRTRIWWIYQNIRRHFPIYKGHILENPSIIRTICRISPKTDAFGEIMACPTAFDFSYNDLYINVCETIWRMYHAIVNLRYWWNINHLKLYLCCTHLLTCKYETTCILHYDKVITRDPWQMMIILFIIKVFINFLRVP